MNEQQQQPNYDFSREIRIADKGKNILVPVSMLLGGMCMAFALGRLSNEMSQQFTDIKRRIDNSMWSRSQMREFAHEIKLANPQITVPNPDEIAARIDVRRE